MSKITIEGRSIGVGVPCYIVAEMSANHSQEFDQAVKIIEAAKEAGADAVYVVGCPVDSCHNVKGSQRAAKRVGAVKQALSELGVEAERIEMFHLERGFHPEFIAVAQEMDQKIKKLGPSPLKGEPA